MHKRHIHAPHFSQWTIRSFLGPVAAPRLKAHSPFGCSTFREERKFVAAHVHACFFFGGDVSTDFCIFPLLARELIDQGDPLASTCD